MMKKMSIALIAMIALTTMAIAAPKVVVPARASKALVAPKVRKMVKKSHKKHVKKHVKAAKAILPVVAPVKR